MDRPHERFLRFPAVPAALTAAWSRGWVQVQPAPLARLERVNHPDEIPVADLRAFWADLGDFLRAVDAQNGETAHGNP